MTTVVRLDDGALTAVDMHGTGPAVLCIHGITSSRRSWTRLAEYLADRYRTIAYDQRGHGDSAAVSGPMTLERSVADSRSVLDAAGGEAAAVIGHSWGGAVALLAGQDPRIRSVIAVDPMVRVRPGTWGADYLDDTAADMALEPQERERVLRARHADWHPLDVEGKLHAVRSMTAEPIARLGSENHVDRAGWNLLPSLADYPKPLLFCVADPSESVVGADDLSLIRRSAGRKLRVVEFPGEGHNLHRTAFERFAAAVDAFIGDAGVPQARPSQG
ncbi:MAG: alpha/beta hydrolase [Candidatus Eremiobacteraeota bacterium]|nr:alpha/beta hydrolase [Candidatus Eremiobacteraeota bacterium]